MKKFILTLSIVFLFLGCSSANTQKRVDILSKTRELPMSHLEDVYLKIYGKASTVVSNVDNLKKKDDYETAEELEKRKKELLNTKTESIIGSIREPFLVEVPASFNYDADQQEWKVSLGSSKKIYNYIDIPKPLPNSKSLNDIIFLRELTLDTTSSFKFKMDINEARANDKKLKAKAYFLMAYSKRSLQNILGTFKEYKTSFYYDDSTIYNFGPNTGFKKKVDADYELKKFRDILRKYNYSTAARNFDSTSTVASINSFVVGMKIVITDKDGKEIMYITSPSGEILDTIVTTQASKN